MVALSNSNDLGGGDLAHTVDGNMVKTGPLDYSIDISYSGIFINNLGTGQCWLIAVPCLIILLQDQP